MTVSNPAWRRCDNKSPHASHTWMGHGTSKAWLKWYFCRGRKK